MNSRIVAHTLVRNEERYLWFAVASVVEHVDQVLLWDTGSTDATPQIIRDLAKCWPGKIVPRFYGAVDPGSFTTARQEMLEATKSDWVIIVDGDEVWWEDSIRELRAAIDASPGRDSWVSRYYNIVGDIYHYQEEAAGKYTLDGQTGHLTIRAVNRKIPGLHFGGPHGVQGIFNGENVLIQNLAPSRRGQLHGRYLHFTNVVRSSGFSQDRKVPKRELKLKYELGKNFPPDFYYPEVFFRPRPDHVPSPWLKMNTEFYSKALYQTPLRKIRRRVLPARSGY